MKKLLATLGVAVTLAVSMFVGSASAGDLFAKVNNYAGSPCGGSCLYIAYDRQTGATHTAQVGSPAVSGAMNFDLPAWGHTFGGSGYYCQGCSVNYNVIAIGFVFGSPYVQQIVDTWARQPCGAGYRYSQTKTYYEAPVNPTPWWMGSYKVDSVCGASAATVMGPTKLAAQLDSGKALQ